MRTSSRMKLPTTVSLLLILMVGLALFGSTRWATHAASTSTQLLHCGAWNVVPSPNPAGSTNNFFSSVAAVSTNDVWAVGDYETTSSQEETLIEHWNGSVWSVVSSPNAGEYNSLDAVVAVSSNDVWAVGDYETTSYQQHTLVEHWDGTQWSVIPSPSPTDSDQLSALSANSATDIWAIGMTSFKPLVEHWNGTSWSIIPSPNYGIEADLFGVAAVSVKNVWIVGRYETSSFSYRTFTEHWDGTQWNVIPSVNNGALNNNELLGVTRVPGTNQLWAVGEQSKSNYYTLTERWNGQKWSIVASPNQRKWKNILQGVTAISTKNIWAVGDSQNGKDDQLYPLIEHWNGTSWSIVPNPSLPQDAYLAAVTKVPATNQVWAIGWQFTGTLAEFYC